MLPADIGRPLTIKYLFILFWNKMTGCKDNWRRKNQKGKKICPGKLISDGLTERYKDTERYKGIRNEAL